MRHPSETFIKYLIVNDPHATDDELLARISDKGFLLPEKFYLASLRNSMEPKPENFNPNNNLHRASVAYLRQHNIYKLFFPDEASREASSYLIDMRKRLAAEQIILAKQINVDTVKAVNEINRWKLTVDGLEMYNQLYWNTDLLTYDELGRFLYERSSQYETYMALSTAPRDLLYRALDIKQVMDSKDMVRNAQDVAYSLLMEVKEKPGIGADKVKSVGILCKVINDCHATLSTSDVALKDVLKQFETFRMVHPEKNPEPIAKLAPHGNFTNSGKKEEKLKEPADVV